VSQTGEASVRDWELRCIVACHRPRGPNTGRVHSWARWAECPMDKLEASIKGSSLGGLGPECNTGKGGTVRSSDSLLLPLDIFTVTSLA